MRACGPLWESPRILAVVSVGNQIHQLPLLSSEHKGSSGRGDAVGGEGRGPGLREQNLEQSVFWTLWLTCSVTGPSISRSGLPQP